MLSIVEGTWITGPIKPLIMFSRLAREEVADRPTVDLSLVTTVRYRGQRVPGNLLLTGAAAAGVHVDVIRERRAWDLTVMTQLCRVIEAHQPDIVETHQVKCHFILGQALLWRKIRKNFAWIAYHHGYTKANLKLRLYEMLDRWSLRKPDRIVTVCRPFAAELIRHGAAADRVSVIANTVEPKPQPSEAQLNELRRQWGLEDGDSVILSVGRLSPEKGHLDLIEAFKQCLADSPASRKLTLILLGDGPERQRLERAAAGHGSRIRFLGHQADVWPFYFVADIFVLPSHSEGSPLVLFEAMAARKAIVATAVGGIPEAVQDGRSALLVPPCDVTRLKTALTSLVTDRGRLADLALGAAEALKKFSPAAYRDRILAIYQEATRQP